MARRDIRIILAVGPPIGLSGDPVTQLAQGDLRFGELGLDAQHHLVEEDTHRRLLLVLRDGDHIDEIARRDGQLVLHPGEHGVDHRGGVELPEEGQHGRLAGGARFDLRRRVGNFAGDVVAQPLTVDFVAHFPGIDLGKRGNEIGEALLVLRAGVIAVVTGINRLSEDLEPFGLGVVDQACVSRRPLPVVEDDPDPSVRSAQLRGQVEIDLVVRNRVDGKTDPRHPHRLLPPRTLRPVFLE